MQFVFFLTSTLMSEAFDYDTLFNNLSNLKVFVSFLMNHLFSQFASLFWSRAFDYDILFNTLSSSRVFIFFSMNYSVFTDRFIHSFEAKPLIMTVCLKTCQALRPFCHLFKEIFHSKTKPSILILKPSACQRHP